MKALLFFLICFNVFAQNMDKSVTIPLKEYEELKRQLEMPNVMVIEKVSLHGSFKNENFEMRLVGRMIGKPKRGVLLNNFQENLKNCSGDGVFTYENNEVYFLALKDNFRASCELEFNKIGNFDLHFMNVLYFENQVADSESIIQKDSPSLINVQMLRKMGEVKKNKGKIIASARYRITVKPNVSQFEYEIEFNNPNQNKENVVLNLKNNEVIESIESELNVKEDNGKIIAEINPGENLVVIKGNVSANQFQGLLEGENQFFMIESHPLIQVIPQTKWRRIAPSESGINPTQVNSKAFLINDLQPITWEAKKLNAFSSLGYSVSSANYLFYIPKKGRGIIEASFNLDNKGTPEIPFKISGELLYAELDGQAIPMLKDDQENLLISMGQGQHNIKLQYRPGKKVNILGSYTSASLVKTTAVISSSSMNLRLDEAWDLGFANYVSDTFFMIGSKGLVAALIFFLITFILFRYFQIHSMASVYILTPLSVILLLRPDWVCLFYSVVALILIFKYREKIKQISFKGYWIKIGVLIFLLVIVFGIWRLSNNYTRSSYANLDSGSAQMLSNVRDSYAQPEMMAIPRHKTAPSRAMMENDGSGQIDNQEENPNQDFEGIPAQITIPNDGKNYYFNASLIEEKSKVLITFFIMKNYIKGLLIVLLFVAVGAGIYLNKEDIIKKFFGLERS